MGETMSVEMGAGLLKTVLTATAVTLTWAVLDYTVARPLGWPPNDSIDVFCASAAGAFGFAMWPTTRKVR